MNKWLTYLLVLIAAGCSGNDQLDLYKCSNSESIGECSTNCKKDDIRTSFKVNPNNSTVIQHFFLFDSTKVDGAVGLDSCKVVDERNWVCKSDQKFHGYTGYYFHAMTNGLYQMKSEYHGSIAGPDNIYMCAK